MISLNRTVIGMIHIHALPGTPNNKFSMENIMRQAIHEALIYKKCGIDAVAIENMHDIPYLNRRVGPEITAAMAVIGYEIKRQTGLPCGIQVLAGANREALACALVSNLDFIRAEGYIFSHIADEGFMDSCAGELLRYKKQIGAENISIFTDIKKKHSSHAITGDVSITETAKAAEFFLSDGVVITGNATGEKPNIQELSSVKQSVKKIPVLVGSGITIENFEIYMNISDALIVGSWFKEEGVWYNPLSEKRVRAFMEKAKVKQDCLRNEACPIAGPAAGI